jgi:hypothetical protein
MARRHAQAYDCGDYRLTQSDKMAKEPARNRARPPVFALTRFERRHQPVISRRRFVGRMAMALALWLALTALGLAIGIAGYAGFEDMSLVDAYVNAAMILSGMGPLGQLHTTGGKIFAGSYAIFSGLVIVIATSFVLAPIFHRVLHRFHVERERQDDD